MLTRKRRQIRRLPMMLMAIALSGVFFVFVAQTIATRVFSTDGKYWISLPASPRPAVTNAESLLAYGPFATVERLRKADDTYYRWDGTTCCNYDGLSGACTPGVDPDSQGPSAPCTTSCFCVIPGEGYQVSVTGAPRAWEITGFDGVTIVDMKKPAAGVSKTGQNIISLPINLAVGFVKARDLYENVGSGFTQAVTRRFANDTFQSYTGFSAVNNFNLSSGEGYLVKIRTSAPSDFAYTPPQPGEVFDSNHPCVELPTGGTVFLPPRCGYSSPSRIHMLLAGLPPDTEVHLDVSHQRFFNVTTMESVEGTTTETFDSDLAMHITGTGFLSSIDCSLTMSPVHVIIETDPPQVGQPIQDFDADMRSLSGSLSSDTTCNLFDSLNVLAGTDNLMPSPGHVRLVRRPDGTFDVNSYFDVDSAISFVGKPGSILEGMSGTTRLLTRMGPASNVPPAGAGAVPVPDGVFGMGMTCDRLSPDGSTIALHWDVSTCTGEDYNVLYGSLGSIASYALVGAGCNLGATGNATVTGVPPGNLWFVLVAQNGSGTEGSWGVDGADAQRNGGAASAACGNVARDNASSCP